MIHLCQPSINKTNFTTLVTK